MIFTNSVLEIGVTRNTRSFFFFKLRNTHTHTHTYRGKGDEIREYTHTSTPKLHAEIQEVIME